MAQADAKIIEVPSMRFGKYQVRSRLGVPAPAGTTRILGQCDGLYWSDGTQWQLVEGAPSGGVLRLRATLPHADAQWHPLVSWGAGTQARAMVVRRSGDQVRVALAAPGTGGGASFGPNSIDLSLSQHQVHDIEFAAAAPIHLLRVRIDGADAYLGELTHPPVGGLHVGTSTVSGVAPSYGASLRTQLPAISTCRTLLARLH